MSVSAIHDDLCMAEPWWLPPLPRETATRFLSLCPNLLFLSYLSYFFLLLSVCVMLCCLFLFCSVCCCLFTLCSVPARCWHSYFIVDLVLFTWSMGLYLTGLLLPGLWTQNDKWLGRFFGFPPKYRSVSVGFENRNRALLGRFLVGISVKPAKKSTFQSIQCAWVCITCDDTIAWCQERTNFYINQVGGTRLY